MLQDMVHPQDQQLSIEEISSPLGNHILEFCESELFPETVQNSEVGSSSNCSYENHSSYQIHLSNITTEMNNFNNTSIENETLKPPTGTSSGGPSTPTVTAAAATNSNMSIIFDDPTEENDISAAIDFSTSPSFHHDHHHHHHHQYISSSNNNNMNQEPFDINSLNNQLPLGDIAANGSSLHAAHQYGHERWSAVAMMAPPLSSPYEEECLSSYMGRLKSSQPACSLIDTMMVPYLPPAGSMNVPFSAETSGAFSGTAGLMLGTDLSHQDLEFQGDNTALFIPDNMQRVFNCSTDLQGLSSHESQHLYHGGATTSTTSALASEISSLEDPTFKVGKLSVEERKRKIHRYMKKRNERNFSKKIKYACRKTLADSRPRVRGRFAKNDELGEIGRNMGNNNEDDVDEDVGLYSNSIHDHKRKVVVKEEDDQDSSDILAHISGVNSFKCNYPIQSWI